MIIKQKMQILGTVLSIGVALTGALSATDRIRLVDILSLFFGGFGAGVSLVSLIKSLKDGKAVREKS